MRRLSKLGTWNGEPLRVCNFTWASNSWVCKLHLTSKQSLSSGTCWSIQHLGNNWYMYVYMSQAPRSGLDGSKQNGEEKERERLQFRRTKCGEKMKPSQMVIHKSGEQELKSYIIFKSILHGYMTHYSLQTNFLLLHQLSSVKTTLLPLKELPTAIKHFKYQDVASIASHAFLPKITMLVPLPPTNCLLQRFKLKYLVLFLPKIKNSR